MFLDSKSRAGGRKGRVSMTLEAYHRALNQGFSESEACKIADEAFEQYQIDQAQAQAEAEAQAQAEAEAKTAERGE